MKKKHMSKWAWTDEIEEINKMKRKKKMRSINWDWRGDRKKKDKMLIYKNEKKTLLLHTTGKKSSHFFETLILITGWCLG